MQAAGSALAAGYILSGLFAPDALVNTWQLTLLDLGSLKAGLSLRINATFFLGALILIIVKLIQDGGILRSANTTKIIGITAMIPLILIGVVPILTGDMVKDNFFPLVPLAHDAAGHIANGSFNMAGITVIAAGMFLAAWSTYGFETAVCYTGEFKNPKTDTFKAIFYSGLLCVVVYTLVPFSFQGFLGLNGMLAPDIYSGMGVAAVMAKMVHAGKLIGVVVVVLLILALVLSLMTSMAGSSRTLYQASLDGWLPRYLSKCNAHGAPVNAMWTNLVFNLFLLHHRRGQCRVPDVQFPEPERRLDPPGRSPGPVPPVARANVAAGGRQRAVLREPRLHGLWRRYLRRRHARHRT